MAIFLPALGRARESTRRTACLSNLRQNGAAFQAFATHREGKAPLAYWRFKQFNYLVNANQNNEQGLGAWSVFFLEGYITDPQFLLCPSLHDPAFTNLEDAAQVASGQIGSNQWPILWEPETSKRVTRAGYGVRPVADAYAPTSIATRDVEVLPTVRLSDYADRVIASDLVHWQQMLDVVHVDGANTLRGDGSAGWVKREAIEPSLSSLPFQPRFETRYNRHILSEDQTSGVFAELDAAR